MKINFQNIRFIFILTLFINTGWVYSQAIEDTRVKYLSADHVYLDQGSLAGLAIGDRLQIIRNSTPIAEIEVIYLASASSSCKIISKKEDIQIGDKVRMITRKVKVAEKDSSEERRIWSTPQIEKKSKSLTLPAHVSGSFSLQWYHRNDNSAANMDFNQFSTRVNLRVRDLWMPDLSLKINARTRFNHRQKSATSTLSKEEWQNRIYWIGFSYDRQNAPVNFQIGRIISSKFSGIGYLDGILLQHNATESIQWGIFGGVQPDMRSIDFSVDIQKYGIYGIYQSGSYSDTYLRTTLALTGSYHLGTVNREYAYFETRISDKSGWRLNNSMEIDYNRSWRRDYSGENFTLTGFYLSGSYRFNDWVKTGLSYDNRRNYLSYFYHSDAERIFNEAQRHALRGDIRFYLPASTSVTLNLGARRGQGDSQTSFSYGIRVAKSDLFIKKFQANLAFTGFNNIYNEGINPSASLRYQSGPIGIVAAYGLYRYRLADSNNYRSNQWINITLSLPLWSRIFLFNHFYYDRGDDMKGIRLLTEIAYRF